MRKGISFAVFRPRQVAPSAVAGGGRVRWRLGQPGCVNAVHGRRGLPGAGSRLVRAQRRMRSCRRGPHEDHEPLGPI